jgi:GAF domain-containing protein
MSDGDPMQPASRLSDDDAIAELGKIDFGDHDLQSVLGRVATLAQRTIEGACEVSVTIVGGGAAYTAAFTGPTALLLDETQYEAGYGPCLDAAVNAQSIYVSDMSTESRWPLYTPTAVVNGVLSSMSLPLPVQSSVVGALNVYSTERDGFGAGAREVAETFAGYAAVAIANAALYADATTQAEQMRDAMEHRAVIEQAKGVIMGDRRCGAEEAFDILRSIANAADRSLREVAEALVAETQKHGPTQDRS